jgi:hypothetical protein
MAVEKQGQVDVSAADQLYDAAWREDATRVRELLQAGVPVDAVSSHGFPALYAAIENGHTVVDLILDHGASVHSYAGSSGWSPLSHAVESVVLCVTDRVPDAVPPLMRVIESLCRRGVSPDEPAKPLGVYISPRAYAQQLFPDEATRGIASKLLQIFSQGSRQSW